MNFMIMSEHGASLQTYNQELVKCLEDLKVKRDDIREVIKKQEHEKALLEKNMKILQEKLNTVNLNLESQRKLFERYDRTITDTENGFKKILDSSQTLLNLAQQQASKLKSANNVRNVCAQ